MKKVVLEATKLCKSFSNEGVQNHVLNDLDLEIYEGDFTVIMGSSGSGKSTLLYSLSGMDKPTAGRVLYRGEDITKYNEKKMSDLRVHEFGFVFQQVHLVGNLSLEENILVPGYMNNKMTQKEVKDRSAKLMERMNITAAAKRLPSQVSGGEAQRAAIARAVINKPGLLFADEPTGALNRKNTEDVLQLMTGLNQEGQSILMVTHDIKAAIFASRLIYLEDGKVCGELELPPFDAEKRKNREIQVNAWLSSMQW
ncbi:MAG TPA: ABC transporter ATP-binding protein [Clostridium sp.]|jgi:putative ABC transport system ATP-binding protein|nr:ABC transporter ATP-binding protein [Clostridium sp.]